MDIVNTTPSMDDQQDSEPVPADAPFNKAFFVANTSAILVIDSELGKIYSYLPIVPLQSESWDPEENLSKGIPVSCRLENGERAQASQAAEENARAEHVN